MGKISNLSTKT